MNIRYKKGPQPGTYEVFSESGELLGVLVTESKHGIPDLGDEGYLFQCDTPVFYAMQYADIRKVAEEEGKVAPTDEQCAEIAHLIMRCWSMDWATDFADVINEFDLPDADNGSKADDNPVGSEEED